MLLSDFLLYDYISIYSDPNYIGRVQTIDIEYFFLTELKFDKIRNLRFSKMIQGELVIATGILAKPNGNYSYDTLDEIEEINLIEIDIPFHMTIELQASILKIANQIAQTFSWHIDEFKT